MAVVSPMPSLKKKSNNKALASAAQAATAALTKEPSLDEEEAEEGEDSLKSLVPMAPLFRSPSAGAMSPPGANASRHHKLPSFGRQRNNHNITVVGQALTGLFNVSRKKLFAFVAHCNFIFSSVVPY